MTAKTEELLEQLIYCDFRTEVDIDKARSMIRRAFIKQEKEIKNKCVDTHGDKQLVEEGWSKFPCTRPLNGRSLKVMIDGVEKRGVSIETPRYPIESYSGTAIKIEHQVIDSNKVLWWKYESEGEGVTGEHKIKFVHHATKYEHPAVLAVCKCGWNSPIYNENYDFVGKVLKDDVFEHLVKIGIIEN